MEQADWYEVDADDLHATRLSHMTELAECIALHQDVPALLAAHIARTAAADTMASLAASKGGDIAVAMESDD